MNVNGSSGKLTDASVIPHLVTRPAPTLVRAGFVHALLLAAVTSSRAFVNVDAARAV